MPFAVLGSVYWLLLAISCNALAETSFNGRADELIAQMSVCELVSQLNTDSPPIQRLNITAFNWWQGVSDVSRPSEVALAAACLTAQTVFQRKQTVHQLSTLVA